VEDCPVPACDCAGLRSKILAGDQSAASKLVESLTPFVNRMVMSMLRKYKGAVEECDDTVQEVFLKVILRLGSWNAECPFCHWVGAIARRRAIDHLRRLTRSNRNLAEFPNEDRIVDPCPPPSLEQRECIKRVYDRLPERSRQVFDLAAEGTQRKEIAKKLAIGERMVFMHLEEIRIRLQPCWER
jgi:RNA polymerase sigma factor (sigma-70 family)